jgi:hypothetical protein
MGIWYSKQFTKTSHLKCHIAICSFSNDQKDRNNQKNQYTVKPVYSGHLGEFDKMTTIYRWPLYEGT